MLCAGRSHKSNGIYLIANRKLGVFYQKCHDPDCQRAEYRSSDLRIPHYVLDADNSAEEDALEQAMLQTELPMPTIPRPG